MKYGIDYRVLKKGATKLIDNSTMARAVDVEVDDDQFALIPNVGDYVDMEGEHDMRNIPLHGVVKSRLFRYVMGYCYITIVVEEDDSDWTLIGL